MDDDPNKVPRRLLSPEALRVLAQPVRLRIQAQLQHGPANATTLAHVLGESTGLISHHLRQLAKHGFVEEVPELARGRERWWRLARVDWRAPSRAEQDPQTRALMEEIARLELATDLQEFTSAQQELADQLPYSRGVIHVTAAELKEFFEEYITLLNRYRPPAGQAPPGSRPVVTSFMAYPAPSGTEEGQ